MKIKLQNERQQKREPFEEQLIYRFLLCPIIRDDADFTRSENLFL